MVKFLEKLNTNLLDALQTLLTDVKDYDRVFDRYRFYLRGYDLGGSLQEATNDPIRAKESLEELNTCLTRIVNDVIGLTHILHLGYEYPEDQISTYNDNLVDTYGTCSSVQKCFSRLKNPDKL